MSLLLAIWIILFLTIVYVFKYRYLAIICKYNSSISFKNFIGYLRGLFMSVYKRYMLFFFNSYIVFPGMDVLYST